jgi:hypothetical protein
VYATSAGSTAADGTGRNGLFTSHLLKNLKTPGMEVKEIFNRTGSDVRRASNSAQVPAIYSQFFETAYLGSAPGPRVESTTGTQSGPRINTVIETGSLVVTAATAGVLQVLSGGKAVVNQNVAAGSSTTIRDLTVGSYTVRLDYAGNQKEEKQLTITAAGSTAAAFTYKAIGSISVTVATAGNLQIVSGGKAVVNQSVAAGSRTTISDLDAGPYTVSMKYSADKTEEKMVTVSANNTAQAAFTFQPQVAQVQAQPATPQQTITPAAKPAALPTQTATGKYKIGNKGPGGGIVFQVNGDHGMEVSGLLGTYKWKDAVKKAKVYKGGGFSDWHLPTRDELNLVYLNLQKPKIADMGSYFYWSSSESNDLDAWSQYFSDGRRSLNHKNLTYSVRAVRAF